MLRNILKLSQAPHPLIYQRKDKYTNLQNLLIFMYEDGVLENHIGEEIGEIPAEKIDKVVLTKE